MSKYFIRYFHIMTSIPTDKNNLKKTENETLNYQAAISKSTRYNLLSPPHK